MGAVKNAALDAQATQCVHCDEPATKQRTCVRCGECEGLCHQCSLVHDSLCGYCDHMVNKDD